MSDITITHTAEAGTLVEGTSKGDGTNTVLKWYGFRWFRTLGCWGIAASRDRQPKEYAINRAAQALREAGHTVTVDIDRGHRPAEDAEADRIARQDARADAIAAKADRHRAAAEVAHERADRAHQALPPGGEPIKVGHHSESRHRKAIEKSWNTLGKAVAADTKAQASAQRAETAAATTGRRYNPVTVANRIETLEADQRADQRALDGHGRTLYRDNNGDPVIEDTPPAAGTYRERLTARMAQRADDITYWTGVRAQQITEGKATNYSRETICVGDVVRGRHRDWYPVVRVNAKSVTISYPAPFGGAMLTDTIKYAHLSGHRPATIDAGDAAADESQEAG